MRFMCTMYNVHVCQSKVKICRVKKLSKMDRISCFSFSSNIVLQFSSRLTISCNKVALILESGSAVSRLRTLLPTVGFSKNECKTCPFFIQISVSKVGRRLFVNILASSPVNFRKGTREHIALAICRSCNVRHLLKHLI